MGSMHTHSSATLNTSHSRFCSSFTMFKNTNFILLQSCSLCVCYCLGGGCVTKVYSCSVLWKARHTLWSYRWSEYTGSQESTPSLMEWAHRHWNSQGSDQWRHNTSSVCSGSFPLGKKASLGAPWPVSPLPFFAKGKISSIIHSLWVCILIT